MTTLTFRPNGFREEDLVTALLDFMTQQSRLGLKAMAAAADVIAAECNMNAWLAEDKWPTEPRTKQVEKLSFEEYDKLWGEFLELVESGHEKCMRAMSEYAAGGSQGQLCHELAQAAACFDIRNIPGYK